MFLFSEKKRRYNIFLITKNFHTFVIFQTFSAVSQNLILVYKIF